jgi:hypothetical protein
MDVRFSKIPIYCLGVVAIIVAFITIFHLGGVFALRVGQFAPLFGAFIGGTFTLWNVSYFRGRKEQTQPWTGQELLSWQLIGYGILLWGLGECFWRYYVSIGQTPFPSMADIGYSAFPLLIFAGLLLQPRPDGGERHILLFMDSLISMGAILAISWYLLLGSLAQASGENNLAKFLGLYYPLADILLLSCVIFLLLRGEGTKQSRARRISLLVIILGLCFFVSCDFLFNVENNLGTFVEGSWTDLGWAFGMVTIGIAAYLRRFLPITGEQDTHTDQQRSFQVNFRPIQFVPYGLLGILLIMLVLNVSSFDSTQVAIRPILLYATVAVIALVMVRQIVTLRENIRLSQQQAEALDNLKRANQQVTEQAAQIAQYNTELEYGISHLSLIQAQMANGNLRVRATLQSGVLLPLAGSLNIMAERLMRMGQENERRQHLVEALRAVLTALQESQRGNTVAIPDSYTDIPEINHLLTLLHFKRGIQSLHTNNPEQGKSLVSGSEKALRPPTSVSPWDTPSSGNNRSRLGSTHLTRDNM